MSDAASTSSEASQSPISSPTLSTSTVATVVENMHPSQEDIDKAAEFKNGANAHLLKANYEEAINLYTKAIELDATKVVYWANRAQAYIKSEMYGLAVADASKAIAIDPNYAKSYYRRAVAYAAIAKPKDALKDFRMLVKKAPADKDARAKLAECDKLVRKMAFEEAIAVADPPSAFESLELENMVVEEGYDGVRLSEEMTEEFVQDMVERFKNGKTIHKKYVYQILKAVKDIVYNEPTMVEIDVKEDQVLTVCGDTHGQFFDVLEIFRRNGTPSPQRPYLFNGDFVDRGSWSTEVALMFYAYKWLYPNHIFLNRGNHETDDMNKIYGFEGECKAKYNELTFKLFSESFSALPLACLIGGKYFVLHGGLFSDDTITLDDVRKLNRHARRQPGQEGLMMEMLWTDPQPEPGRGPSKRGVGLQFGPDITKRFCENNGLDAIIRSHEVRMGGYEVEHDGRCVTIFSAPNYCDQQGNLGAWIKIEGKDKDLKMNFETFTAVEHPKLPPMAYANQVMR
ncbi:Palmitoyl-protein thioesterase 1 [Saitoella coloradoensis]